MTERADAFRRYQNDIALFSRDIIRIPLHPYQAVWAQYIADVVAANRTETITVEMPRQSGKNEASAQLEAFLLARHGRRGGAIVKCAPTWKPQIVNSLLRLEQRADMMAERLPFLRVKGSMGYIKRLKRAEAQFLSAEPNASVVGATASLLMEVDEAQDVDAGTYDKKFSPMRASRGCPLVAYGTTWTDDTLLERFKRDVSEGRSAGRNFRILPDQVAESNPRYGEYVDGEVRRLGRDHPLIKTQYFLEPLPNAGRMLKPQQLRLLLGDHERQERRGDERQIVAGLDFAGADEEAGDLVSLANPTGRDSVALTIGAVDWLRIAEGLLIPTIRLLARYEWVNVNPVSLHSLLYELLWQRWRVDRAHCDATGIGATSTAFLAQALAKHGEGRIVPITFDGAWLTHTDITFDYLAAVHGGRLTDYRVTFDPLAVAGQEAPDESDPDRHIWWQRGHARLQTRPNQRVKASVPDSEGHDDLLISEMLLVDAAYSLQPPQVRRKPQSREY